MEDNSGTFTISLDTELAWGRISSPGVADFYELFRGTREVIERLVALFDKYDTRVTWAMVGRMIEPDHCQLKYNGPELAQYFQERLTEECYQRSELNLVNNSFLRYPEVVDLLKNSTVDHELGSHSYNHFFFKEVDQPDLVTSDFKAMNAVTSACGFTARSLVFPKNQIAHLDIVAKSGIKVYRGEDQHWYSSAPAKLQRLLRQLDLILPIAASGVKASQDKYGLINIPGSMVFRREHRGWKRYIPISMLSRKAIAGIKRAADNGTCVHLWFHPFNFAYKPEQHFKAMEEVLSCVAELRKAGKMQVFTMGDYARQA